MSSFARASFDVAGYLASRPYVYSISAYIAGTSMMVSSSRLSYSYRVMLLDTG